MKKKKAFTLVELLAVIVIIAIIALIATPIVLNVINNAEKGAFLRSVDGYVRAVQNKYMLNIVENQDATEEFVIIEGKVNGETIITNENQDYKGIINFKVLDNSYFLSITNGKYCAYKNYNDLKPEMKDLEYCNIDFENGIYEPIIEVTDENVLTETKSVTINFINDINTNEYCIGTYETSIDECLDWNIVNDSSVEFQISEDSVIYGRVSNIEKTLTTFKKVTNFGNGIKNPVILGLSSSSDDETITVTVTAESYNESAISKYYYKINDSEYIESSNSYYTFDVEPYINHTISVYVKDSNNLISEISTLISKATYVPTITVTNENNLVLEKIVTIDYKNYSDTNKYTNEYCLLNSGETLDNCSWTIINDTLAQFTISEDSIIYARVTDESGVLSLVGPKNVTNFGQEVKKPIINTLTTTSSEDTITVTVTAESYNESTISKYYYKIDDTNYIVSANAYYTFTDVESYVDHTISVYVEDSNNLMSEISNTTARTTRKIPTIDTLTTTSGENDITVTVTSTAYNDATIEKYYYNINDEEYIETTESTYNFSDLTVNKVNKFSVYVVDSNGLKSNVSTITAVTTEAVPELTIVVNGTGYEYNGELWYPYNTTVILNYSNDMTDKTGYYQTVNESSKVESSWSSNSSNKKKTVRLTESMTYRIKIISSDGKESEVVEQKINIMPRTDSTSGIPTNYYTYNMGGIYPVYISTGIYINGYLYGTDRYNNYNGRVAKAAAHMGLISHDGNYTTESKLLYIKLIPCPEEGYIGSTRNGITSSSRDYNTGAGYYGFIFVKEDGTEMYGAQIVGITSSEEENDITVTVTAESQTEGASISKYYYSIDSGSYIESTNNYYKFEDLTPYINHTISVYVKDSNGIVSEISTITSATTKALPTPEIIINGTGYEYNGELWYPYNTKITLSYSEDMTNLTGYYQKVNESSKVESSWSTTTSSTQSLPLYESFTYRIKIIDKTGRESEVVEQKINIMPRTDYKNGIPTNYYTYNMGGIYPVYISTGISIRVSLYGTDRYNNYFSQIAQAAAHMGLISHDGNYTTESKLLYIKLIPCPEEGYIGSTRNGITSSSRDYNTAASYYGFIFVTEDGTEIIGE